MEYETTKVEAVNPRLDTISTKMLVKAAKRLPTWRLLLICIVQQKIPLLVAGNVLLVLNWAFPAWPELIKSIF